MSTTKTAYGCDGCGEPIDINEPWVRVVAHMMQRNVTRLQKPNSLGAHAHDRGTCVTAAIGIAYRKYDPTTPTEGR